MSEFSRHNDLGRLNWRGWVVLAATAATMTGGIIFSISGQDVGIVEDRSGRKIIGFVIALFSFGIFIYVREGLKALGISIYRDGQDPSSSNAQCIGTTPDSDSERASKQLGSLSSTAAGALIAAEPSADQAAISDVAESSFDSLP